MQANASKRGQALTNAYTPFIEVLAPPLAITLNTWSYPDLQFLPSWISFFPGDDFVVFRVFFLVFPVIIRFDRGKKNKKLLIVRGFLVFFWGCEIQRVLHFMGAKLQGEGRMKAVNGPERINKKTHKQKLDYPGTVPAFSYDFLGILFMVPFLLGKREHINKIDPHPFSGQSRKVVYVNWFHSPPGPKSNGWSRGSSEINLQR